MSALLFRSTNGQSPAVNLREALLAGTRVKQAIEAEYRGALGEAGFAALMQAFEILDGETD